MNNGMIWLLIGFGALLFFGGGAIKGRTVPGAPVNTGAPVDYGYGPYYGGGEDE